MTVTGCPCPNRSVLRCSHGPDEVVSVDVVLVRRHIGLAPIGEDDGQIMAVQPAMVVIGGGARIIVALAFNGFPSLFDR